MRIAPDTRIWVVTDAGPHSTLPDVLHETTLAGFMLQVRGGLNAEANPTLYTDHEEALEEGKHRLLAWKVAAQIREQRGLPADEVVRVTLHGADGAVIGEWEVR